jgi:hypothetical protein
LPLHRRETRSEAGAAREFYKRVLRLCWDTGCSVQMALRACEDAGKKKQQLNNN